MDLASSDLAILSVRGVVNRRVRIKQQQPFVLVGNCFIIFVHFGGSPGSKAVQKYLGLIPQPFDPHPDAMTTCHSGLVSNTNIDS